MPGLPAGSFFAQKSAPGGYRGWRKRNIVPLLSVDDLESTGQCAVCFPKHRADTCSSSADGVGPYRRGERPSAGCGEKGCRDQTFRIRQKRGTLRPPPPVSPPPTERGLFFRFARSNQLMPMLLSGHDVLSASLKLAGMDREFCVSKAHRDWTASLRSKLVGR